jgi:hypothetical protein
MHRQSSSWVRRQPDWVIRFLSAGIIALVAIMIGMLQPVLDHFWPDARILWMRPGNFSVVAGFALFFLITVFEPLVALIKRMRRAIRVAQSSE